MLLKWTGGWVDAHHQHHQTNCNRLGRTHRQNILHHRLVEEDDSPQEPKINASAPQILETSISRQRNVSWFDWQPATHLTWPRSAHECVESTGYECVLFYEGDINHKVENRDGTNCLYPKKMTAKTNILILKTNFWVLVASLPHQEIMWGEMSSLKFVC